MSKYFVFDKGLNESENWANVKLPYSETNSPVKVLFILDRMPKEDFETGKLLSGLTGDLLQNMLQYTKKTYAPTTQWFSWAAISWAAYRTFGRTDDFIEQAHQDFTTRCKAMIARYKPDFVVGFGTDVQDAFIPHKLTTDQKGNTRYSYWLGQPIACKVKEHSFKFISNLSLDIIARGSFTEAFMLGYMSRCLLPIFGKRYAVDSSRLSNHKAYLLDSVRKVEKLFETLADKPVIAIDSETTNLNRITNKLLTMQYAYDQDKAFVIPIYHRDTPFSPKELSTVLQIQKEFFETKTDAVHVYANAKFDLLRIREEIGVDYYEAAVVDIFAGEFVNDENYKTLSTVLGEWYYSLANISVQYGFEGYLDAKFGKADRTNIANVALTEDVLHYMGLDVVVPIAIFEQQKKHAADIKYTKWLDVVRYDISDTIHAFTEMEHTGALVDVPHLFYLRTRGSPIEKVIEEMEHKLLTSKAAIKANGLISKQLAIPTTDMFNQSVAPVLRLSKPVHKQTLFFDVLKLKPLSVGVSGVGKIDKVFQQTYAAVPEVAMFTAVEKAKKLKNAYVKSFITLLGESEDFQADYRIRPTFHFLRVVTHRGAACLAGDTPVYVLDERRQVAIKDVKAGDWVWCFDDELKPVPKKVSWAGYTKTDKTVTVHCSDTETKSKAKAISCTADHLFRISSGKYVRAAGLECGTQLLSLEICRGQPEKKLFVVTSVVVNKGVRKVYDITVPEHHNFIANGVCVHNSAPNLQNIPTHSPLAKHIKRMFVSRPGTLYAKVDYKAHEVRIWGVVALDKAIAELFMAATKLVNAYRLNPTPELKARLTAEADIHIQNAAYFFKKSIAELVADKERKDRSAVKGVVFGLIYQKSVRKLAEELGRELEWMQELVSKFFKRFPNGMKWLDNAKTFSKKHLFIEGPSGIRRNLWGYMLPDSHEEANMIHSKMARQACNCIVGDSRIATDSGVFSIRSLVGKTFNVRTKDGSYAHATICVSKGVKKTVKITTRIGVTQTSTPDHEFYVKDVAGNFVWKAAGKMSTTDSLCMPLPEQIGSAKYYFADVVSVEDAGEQEVFDISVPGPSHFLSNGCVCHNSPVQGLASRLMMMGIRILSGKKRDAVKKWKDFVFHISNSVHDSLENEVGYKHFLYSLGMIEDSLTKAVARKFYDRHKFQINSVPEIEFEIGPHLAATETWDFSAAVLERIVVKSLMIQRNDLGHKIDVDFVLQTIFHEKAIAIAPEWFQQQLKNTGYKFTLTEKSYIAEMHAEALKTISSGEALLESATVAKDEKEIAKATTTVNSGKSQLEAAEKYEQKRKQA